MRKIAIIGACAVSLFSMPVLAAPAGQVDDVPKPAVTSDLETPVYAARSDRPVSPQDHLASNDRSKAQNATANDDARTSDGIALSNSPPR